jgi:flagellar biosynthesis protein FlhF
MMPEPYIDTVQAPTLAQCKALARERYGEQAYIYRHKTVRNRGFFGFLAKESVIASVIVPPPKNPAPPMHQPPPAPQKPVAPDPVMVEILDRLKTLEKLDKKLDEKINEKLAASQPGAPQKTEHETLARLRNDMERNDFSPSFMREIVERARGEFSLEVLDDYHEVQQNVLIWIGERIKIYDEVPRKHPRIIVLVCPTGVGKTTTVCKLAASLKYPGNDEERQNVCLVTIDMYRIAAAKQLGELADILNARFIAVSDRDELKKEIALRSDSFDAILVDTIGRSPHDAPELADMKRILEACGPDAEVYLTFTASAKYSDIVETMRQFETFGYRAVIVTKLDETKKLGNVISALAEESKPIAFVTDGQHSTPKYIKKANKLQLLTSLEGFMPDRERLEQYFVYGGGQNL